MDEKEYIEVLLERYRFLREEIALSLQNQQNTLNWSSVATGVILIFATSLWGVSKLLTLGFFILVFPTAIITFLNIYLSEIARMMRSGRYLYLLEDEIQQYIPLIGEKQAKVPWFEHWLREQDKHGGTRQIKSGYKSGVALYLGVTVISHMVANIILWAGIDDLSIFLKIAVSLVTVVFNIWFILSIYKRIKEDILK